MNQIPTLQSIKCSFDFSVKLILKQSITCVMGMSDAISDNIISNTLSRVIETYAYDVYSYYLDCLNDGMVSMEQINKDSIVYLPDNERRRLHVYFKNEYKQYRDKFDKLYSIFPLNNVDALKIDNSIRKGLDSVNGSFPLIDSQSDEFLANELLSGICELFDNIECLIDEMCVITELVGDKKTLSNDMESSRSLESIFVNGDCKAYMDILTRTEPRILARENDKYRFIGNKAKHKGVVAQYIKLLKGKGFVDVRMNREGLANILSAEIADFYIAGSSMDNCSNIYDNIFDSQITQMLKKLNTN